MHTRNEWCAADATKIMDEQRWVTMYDLGKSRLIVVEIDLHASVCPITFADTKEGAFGIRINDVINAEGRQEGQTRWQGQDPNAEGKIGEKECWGQKSALCDYSGPIDGKVVGLAIFDDPKNPDPRLRHVRGYGLMAANPFGREKHAQFPAMKGNNELVRLKKGEHLNLRYGMLLHTGDAVSGDVAAAYDRFVKLRAKGLNVIQKSHGSGGRGSCRAVKLRKLDVQTLGGSLALPRILHSPRGTHPCPESQPTAPRASPGT